MSRCIFTSLVLICFIMLFPIEQNHAGQTETALQCQRISNNNFAVSSLTYQSSGPPYGVYNAFLVMPEGKPVNTSLNIAETGLKSFTQAGGWHNESVPWFENVSVSNELIEQNTQSASGCSGLFSSPFRLLMPAITVLMIHYEYNQLAVIFVSGSLMLRSDWITGWIGDYEPYRQYLKTKIKFIGYKQYEQTNKMAGYFREMPGYLSVLRYCYDPNNHAEPSDVDSFTFLMGSREIASIKWKNPEGIMTELGIVHRSTEDWLKQEIDNLNEDDLVREFLTLYSMELLNLAAQFNEVLWRKWQDPHFSSLMKVLGLQAVFNYWFPIEAPAEEDDCSLLTMPCLLNTMSDTVINLLSKYWLVIFMIGFKISM